MLHNGIKVYKFSRGEKFSCYVSITADEHISFTEIVMPVNVEKEVQVKFLDDAEREALKIFNAEKSALWSN